MCKPGYAHSQAGSRQWPGDAPVYAIGTHVFCTAAEQQENAHWVKPSDEHSVLAAPSDVHTCKQWLDMFSNSAAAASQSTCFVVL
jgi:hypothetical protein